MLQFMPLFKLLPQNFDAVCIGTGLRINKVQTVAYSLMDDAFLVHP